MNRRLSLVPPNVTLATSSGMRILPISEPSPVIAMDALCSAGPDAAIPIDAKTVEQARGRLRENLAARQLGSAGVDREAANVARTVLLVRRAGVGDIGYFSSGEKAMPFGRTISV